MAAAALDGGDAAEEAAAELSARGDSRRRRRPSRGRRRLARSPRSSRRAAASGERRGRTAVDVVAAAEGTCCRVQVVRIRGTIADVRPAVELPDGRVASSGLSRTTTKGPSRSGSGRPIGGGGGGGGGRGGGGAGGGARGGGAEGEGGVFGRRRARGDAPDAILVPHALPDAPGLERIIARASTAGDDAGTSDAKGRRRRTTRTTRTLRHGSDLPEGLPAALASLAKANAAEAARRAAREAAASAAVADIVGVPGRPIRSIEGVDVSHLAGSATAASVLKFTDGAADPAGHRRYDLDVVAARPDGGGGTTGFDGDDPGRSTPRSPGGARGSAGWSTFPTCSSSTGASRSSRRRQALSDAGVVVVNARAPDGTLVGSPEEASSNALGPARRWRSRRWPRGGSAARRRCTSPRWRRFRRRRAATRSGSPLSREARTRRGARPPRRGRTRAAGRGSSSCGPFETSRTRRRSARTGGVVGRICFGMRGQGVGDSPGPGGSDFGFGSGAGAGDSSDEEEREMSALG